MNERFYDLIKPTHAHVLINGRIVESGDHELAKKIDAVYSDDPEINPDAVKYESLTHTEVLEQDLKVMDATAAALCRDNDISIHVFALAEEGNVMKAVCGEKIGTIVSGR